jgi:hypothetical protein
MLPTISPRERTLIIKAPKVYRKNLQNVVERGEYTQRCQNEDIQKLKELFERSINKDQATLKTLPTINRSPLRVKSTEPTKKNNQKIMITTYRRFQGTKPLINKKKDKNNKPIFSLNSLSVVSRSLSKKSFEKSIFQAKELHEKKALESRIKVSKRNLLSERDESFKRNRAKNNEARQSGGIDKEESKGIQKEILSESDEDRMEIYHEFKFV